MRLLIPICQDIKTFLPTASNIQASDHASDAIKSNYGYTLSQQVGCRISHHLVASSWAWLVQDLEVHLNPTALLLPASSSSSTTTTGGDLEGDNTAEGTSGVLALDEADILHGTQDTGTSRAGRDIDDEGLHHSQSTILISCISVEKRHNTYKVLIRSTTVPVIPRYIRGDSHIRELPVGGNIDGAGHGPRAVAVDLVQGQGELRGDLRQGVAGDLLHGGQLGGRVDIALLRGPECALLEGRGVGLAVGRGRRDAEGEGFAAGVAYCVAIRGSRWLVEGW